MRIIRYNKDTAPLLALPSCLSKLRKEIVIIGTYRLLAKGFSDASRYY